jgi:hypothetical protein
VNVAVSFNGLRSPTVSPVIVLMQWATLLLSAAVIVLCGAVASRSARRQRTRRSGGFRILPNGWASF